MNKLASKSEKRPKHVFKDEIGVLDHQQGQQQQGDHQRRTLISARCPARLLDPLRSEKRDQQEEIGQPDIPRVPITIEEGAPGNDQRQPMPCGNGQMKQHVNEEKQEERRRTENHGSVDPYIALQLTARYLDGARVNIYTLPASIPPELLWPNADTANVFASPERSTRSPK